MKDKKYSYEYPRPAVTTDCAIFSIDEAQTYVLLIERGNEPFKGQWAFPGGFLDMDEDALTCAKRELLEETHMSGVELHQVYTASAVDRDPRGRTISIVYCGVVDKDKHVVKAGDDAAKAEWFALDNLPALAFDHDEVLEHTLTYLKERR